MSLTLLQRYPGAVILPNFPYKSQRDNRHNPSGSCNVTSIAMCLWFLGIRGDGSQGGQLEDQMYVRCLERDWSRHTPEGLKAVAESYGGGIFDKFTEFGTLDMIRASIDAGIPCVVHGYFTHYGHILTIKGHTPRGFIVNDPWGEYWPGGYDTSVSGENLHYSTGMIARLCSPESIGNPSNIFLHRIGKK